MRLNLKAGLWVLFFLYYSLHGLGQEVAIGDRCPEVRLINYANDEIKSFSLSDFNSKLIIIDFWGTGCTSCLKAFPKIDSLQKKFANEVQFILVNKESPDSTRRFFLKRNRIKIPGVPMVMGDSVLYKLFPHIFIPHYVWLDSNNMVRYVSDGNNMTEKNINDYLRGNNPDIAFKKDIMLYDELLVSKIPEWTKNVVYYSALSLCIPGLDIGNAVASTGEKRSPNRISFNCGSVLELLKVAFSEGSKYNFEPSNTVALNVDDKEKYVYPKDEEELPNWYAHNSYYYELLIPPERSDQLYKIMQKDVARYFDVDVRVEKRKIKCLLLISIGSMDKLKTTGGKPATNFYRMSDDSIRYLKNQSFEQIVNWLTRVPTAYSLSTPVINLVKFTGNVDFEIKSSTINAEQFNLSTLRAALHQYGLDLVEKVYFTDVLVISDKKRTQE